VAADGTIFVLDNFNDRVQAFDQSGNFLYFFGEFGTGAGQFDTSFGIRVAGSIYVTDTGNDRIQVFEKDFEEPPGFVFEPPAIITVIKQVDNTLGGTLTADDFTLFLDGESIPDLVVGAPFDDDGTSGVCSDCNKGAIWNIFLNSSANVTSEQKVSDTEGNFGGTLDTNDDFGTSVAEIGDLDGDGVADYVVGANADDDGATNSGAVWILFMDVNGTVKSEQKISNTFGNLSGSLGTSDEFGQSVANVGDLDGDGVTDIAVGAQFDDDGGTNSGATDLPNLSPSSNTPLNPPTVSEIF